MSLSRFAIVAAVFAAVGSAASAAEHWVFFGTYTGKDGSKGIYRSKLDDATGKLSEVEQVSPGGTMPRNFAIDPTGSYLFSANQLSGTVTLFKVNGNDGRLTPTSPTLKVDVPVSIEFVPIQK